MGMTEFESRLYDERVVAYCNAMKLDVSDARTLFMLMDYDQSGEVNIYEFLDACIQLHGEAQRIDMKIMQCEVRYLHEAFVRFRSAMVDASGGALQSLQMATRRDLAHMDSF